MSRPVVYVDLPRIACPECGAADYLGEPRHLRQQAGSRDQGDGSRSRPMLCGVCGARFALVLEKAEGIQ